MAKDFRTIVFALIIVSIFAMSPISAEEQYVTVDVEEIGADRSSAIENGWLEGIRQAVGSFIDSKTELNNDKLAERIIAYSRGIVEKYEITAVDDSQASEGIYKLNMRLWIARDLLRDGAKHVSSGGFEVDFSPADLRKKQEELNAKELEARNAASETAKKKSQTAAELLEAMLNRYKPKDFLTCYMPGKPEQVEGQPDKFSLKVELVFNEKLYKEAFIPDLIQVLDQIAKVKKNIMLVKYRNELRDIASKKGTPASGNSVIINALEGESDYLLAVYNKPERFGVRIYGFNDDDTHKIIEVLSQYKKRTQRIIGVLLELLDEDKEVIHAIEEKSYMEFLMSGEDPFAIHPTIINNSSENSHVAFTINFEMPEEVIPFVKNLRASLLTGEPLPNPKLKKTAWLGLSINNAPNNSGVIIANIEDNSPAQKAGFKLDDIIIKIDGRKIQGSQDIVQYVKTKYAGQKISVVVNRNGRIIDLGVILGARPSISKDLKLGELFFKK